MEAHLDYHYLFGLDFVVITPSAVKLLVWIGVSGCGWPILASICRTYAASFAVKYRAPSAASAAGDDITALIIVAA
jgi:hypothetical protein